MRLGLSLFSAAMPPPRGGSTLAARLENVCRFFFVDRRKQTEPLFVKIRIGRLGRRRSLREMEDGGGRGRMQQGEGIGDFSWTFFSGALFPGWLRFGERGRLELEAGKQNLEAHNTCEIVPYKCCKDKLLVRDHADSTSRAQAESRAPRNHACIP